MTAARRRHVFLLWIRADTLYGADAQLDSVHRSREGAEQRRRVRLRTYPHGRVDIVRVRLLK